MSEESETIKSLERRVSKLENKIGNLKASAKSPINISNVRWDAVAIAFVWIAVGAMVAFSPHATGKVEEIVGGGVVATFILCIFF